MAIDKAVDSGVLEQGLTKVAKAIRDTTGDTDVLSFPGGMVDSLESLDHIKALKMAYIPFAAQNGWTRKNTIADGTTTFSQYTYYDNPYLALNPFEELPESITAFPDYTFCACMGATFRKLPSQLTEIPEGCFAYCSNLGLTELPDGITNIGEYAFQYCGNLALTKLPSSLLTIGSSAMRFCPLMDIKELPPNLKSIGDYAFYMTMKAIKIKEIPASIESIGNQAFRNCYGITGALTFKGTPATIHSQAFKGCINVKTLNVPWAEGAVSGAPWGFSNATINYDYQEATT